MKKDIDEIKGLIKEKVNKSQGNAISESSDATEKAFTSCENREEKKKEIIEILNKYESCQDNGFCVIPTDFGKKEELAEDLSKLIDEDKILSEFVDWYNKERRQYEIPERDDIIEFIDR